MESVQEKLSLIHEVPIVDLDVIYAKAIQLFQEFHDFPYLVPIWEAKAKGDGLTHEPRITTMWRADEDDPYALAKLIDPLNDREQLIVDTVQKRLPSSDYRYYYISRAYDLLKKTVGDTRDENELIQGLFMMLHEVQESHEYVPMTETELYAVLRKREIDNARDELERLKKNERILAPVITLMKNRMKIPYDVLYYHYYEKFSQHETCEMVKNRGVSLTPDEFRKAREEGVKALIEKGGVQTLVTSPFRKKNGRPKKTEVPKLIPNLSQTLS
jgi:hypothetical protein